MTKDDGIKNFKIGESHRAGMSERPKKTGEAAKPGEQPVSLGFGRIEQLLETEDPVEVGESLTKILRDLNGYHGKAKTNKEKLGARRASAAVERAVDLMDYLYQTKAKMEEDPNSK